MMMFTSAPSVVGERIRELYREFKLPILAAEDRRPLQRGRTRCRPADACGGSGAGGRGQADKTGGQAQAGIEAAGGQDVGYPFEHERAPVRLRQQLERLAEGDFVDRGVNVLAFRMPGTGKTHAMYTIGHRLVQPGRSVLFIPTYRLVQDMLAAKRDLELPRMLRKLDNFDLLVIDDLGYLPRGVGGALHTDRRALRASLAGHHLQPCLLRVGEGVRQPHGYCSGDRQDRASLGHTRVRPAELQDQ